MLQKFTIIENTKYSWFNRMHCLWIKADRLVYMAPCWRGNRLSADCHQKLFFKVICSASWCNGYHYCTTSFNKAWTQVRRRFKSCSRHVGDLGWWGFLTMDPAGNNAKYLSLVNHTTKTIHHHHHHYHHGTGRRLLLLTFLEDRRKRTVHRDNSLAWEWWASEKII